MAKEGRAVRTAKGVEGGGGALEATGWGDRGIEKRLDTKPAAMQRAYPSQASAPFGISILGSASHRPAPSHTLPPPLGLLDALSQSCHSLAELARLTSHLTARQALAISAAQIPAPPRCAVGLRHRQQWLPELRGHTDSRNTSKMPSTCGVVKGGQEITQQLPIRKHHCSPTNTPAAPIPVPIHIEVTRICTAAVRPHE